MSQLAHEMDHFLNEIILKAENQHEILIGSCTSEMPLTNTQEHILMLLSEESLTNSELAKCLNVSQAAVTKAIKSLIKQELLEPFKDQKDARVIFLSVDRISEASCRGASSASSAYIGNLRKNRQSIHS